MNTINGRRAFARNTAALLAAAALSSSALAQATTDALARPATAYQVDAAFDSVHGDGPTAQLLQASDGRFYGTTQYGGAHGAGTVFQFDPATGKTKVLHSFIQDNVDGTLPFGNLVDGGDGYLYGTTTGGGPYFDGTVFRLSRSGQYKVMHAFQGGPTDGMYNYAGLVVGGDGNLYGTTAFGGANGLGVVFRMTRDGAVTLLHSFAGADGSQPQWGLTVGRDGALYGTTNRGGLADSGTAYRITLQGVFTSLHSMSPGVEGTYPFRLLLARNGLFYGATQNGGPSTGGTVFSMTAAGQVALVHAFTQGTPGGDAPSALMQAADGHLWGVTQNYGSNLLGTVFRLSTAGVFTTIHAFAPSSAASPNDGQLAKAPPMQARNGVLYGTTSAGGISGQPGYGTVWQVANP